MLKNIVVCHLYMNIYFIQSYKIVQTITACHDTYTLLGSDKNVAKVIDVTAGATVRLYCHFCTEKDDHEAKFWCYKQRGIDGPMKNITGIDSNDDKIYAIMADNTLMIKNFNTNYDSGIYSCKYRLKAEETLFTYVLDGVFNNNAKPYVGTLNNWNEYKQYIIEPVNEQVEKSKQEPFVTFRKTFNFSFRVKTTWEPWGPCENSSHSKGIRKRIGKCRLQVVPTQIKKSATFSKLQQRNRLIDIYYNLENYDLSCRSIKLNETLPKISKIVRKVPDFVATESCTPNHSLLYVPTNEHEFKYSTIKQIAENGHCTLTCPGVTHSSRVEWFKDEKLLNSTFRNNMGKYDEEPHLTIDSYNTLYIFHATKKEEGVYSCTIDGKNIQKHEIKVVTKDRLLNDDFLRYTIYLGFVLSLTVTCYCAGVCVAWHGKSSFADPLNLNK